MYVLDDGNDDNNAADGDGDSSSGSDDHVVDNDNDGNVQEESNYNGIFISPLITSLFLFTFLNYIFIYFLINESIVHSHDARSRVRVFMEGSINTNLKQKNKKNQDVPFPVTERENHRCCQSNIVIQYTPNQTSHFSV